jgi:hypothetical protein
MADLAIVRMVAGTIQWLIERHDSIHPQSSQISSERLRNILQATVRLGQDTVIEDADFLHCLGMNGSSVTAQFIWRQLLDRIEHFTGPQRQAAETILEYGTLAGRMKQFVQANEGGLPFLYQTLTDCLAQGKMLLP